MAIHSWPNWVHTNSTQLPVLLPEDICVEWKSPVTFSKEGDNPLLWPWFGECVILVGGERWTLKSFAGGGACGQCYFAEYHRTGNIYCIKFLRNADDDEVKFLKSVPRKVFQHPNVAQVIGLAENIKCPELSFDYYESCQGSEPEIHTPSHMIFMEAIPNGELHCMLKSGLAINKNLSEGTMLRFVQDIIRGMAHLTSAGVAHRDLKLANLLIDGHGHIVFSDFGHAKLGSKAGCDASTVSAGTCSLDLDRVTVMSRKSERIGTQGYHPPERFMNFSQEGALHLEMVVQVTTDAAIYEQECRASDLSWPNLSDGRPRTIKMGAQACITDIDLDDLTVNLNDGVKWVPIRALIGFENYESSYDSELADVFALGVVTSRMKSTGTPFKDQADGFHSLGQQGLTSDVWDAWQVSVQARYQSDSCGHNAGFSNDLRRFLDCVWRKNPQDTQNPRPRFADLEKAMDNDTETLVKFPGLKWLATGAPSSYSAEFVRELQSFQPSLSLKSPEVADSCVRFLPESQRSPRCEAMYSEAVDLANVSRSIKVDEHEASLVPCQAAVDMDVSAAALMRTRATAKYRLRMGGS